MPDVSSATLEAKLEIAVAARDKAARDVAAAERDAAERFARGGTIDDSPRSRRMNYEDLAGMVRGLSDLLERAQVRAAYRDGSDPGDVRILETELRVKQAELREAQARAQNRLDADDPCWHALNEAQSALEAGRARSIAASNRRQELETRYPWLLTETA